jgi:hypothetical protein
MYTDKFRRQLWILGSLIAAGSCDACGSQESVPDALIDTPDAKTRDRTLEDGPSSSWDAEVAPDAPDPQHSMPTEEFEKALQCKPTDIPEPSEIPGFRTFECGPARLALPSEPHARIFLNNGVSTYWISATAEDETFSVIFLKSSPTLTGSASKIRDRILDAFETPLQNATDLSVSDRNCVNFEGAGSGASAQRLLGRMCELEGIISVVTVSGGPSLVAAARIDGFLTSLAFGGDAAFPREAYSSEGSFSQRRLNSACADATSRQACLLVVAGTLKAAEASCRKIPNPLLRYSCLAAAAATAEAAREACQGIGCPDGEWCTKDDICCAFGTTSCGGSCCNSACDRCVAGKCESSCDANKCKTCSGLAMAMTGLAFKEFCLSSCGACSPTCNGNGACLPLCSSNKCESCETVTTGNGERGLIRGHCVPTLEGSSCTPGAGPSGGSTKCACDPNGTQCTLFQGCSGGTWCNPINPQGFDGRARCCTGIMVCPP